MDLVPAKKCVHIQKKVSCTKCFPAKVSCSKYLDAKRFPVQNVSTLNVFLYKMLPHQTFPVQDVSTLNVSCTRCFHTQLFLYKMFPR